MRLAWKIAAAAVVAALLAAGWRFLLQGQPASRLAASIALDRAITLLKEDPVAWQPETQQAVRTAAVEAELIGLDTAEAYYVRAIQQQRESNLLTAETLFREAITAAPDWSWPYAALGSLLGRDEVERRGDAEQLLRRAIELDPGWARPHNSLAVVLRLAAKYPEAEQEALRAIELAPDDIAAHNNYANLLMYLGRLEEAEKHYQEALALDPDHPKPYYNLACLYSQEGHLDQAMEMLVAAIRRSAGLRRDAASDPDLTLLRNREDFQSLVYDGETPLPSAQSADQPTLEGAANP